MKFNKILVLVLTIIVSQLGIISFASNVSNISKPVFATVSYLYSQMNVTNENINLTPLKVSDYAEILMSTKALTYQNYEFYRSKINGYVSRDILKAYSEGYIQLELDGTINPDRIMSKFEVFNLLNFPNPPERPIYSPQAKIPVLMYHELAEMPDDGWSSMYVRKEEFIRQLDWLKANAYNTISMEQLYQHFTNNVPLPHKPVVLTFDDAYRSHFDFASVELAKRGMTGTFYIITNRLHKDDYLRNPKSLKRMYNDGMEIGSHTHDHINAKADYDTLKFEYAESKRILDDILKTDTRHFCFPNGFTSEVAVELLKETGYLTAVRESGMAMKSQGMLNLKRVWVDYYDGIDILEQKIKE